MSRSGAHISLGGSNVALSLSSVEAQAHAQGKGVIRKRGAAPKKQNLPLADIDWKDSQAIWDYYVTPNEKGDVCNFFSGVEIDQEAGFGEVTDMTEPWRPFAAVFYCLWLLFNWFSILRVAFFTIMISLSAPEGYTETAFTISGYLYLQATGNRIPSGLIISSLELMTLVSMTFMVFYTLCQAICARSECIRWHKFAYLAMMLFPISISLSAVKLLNFATPTILVPAMLQTINQSFEHNATFTAITRIVSFIVRRMAYLFIGFDTFLFRFQVLAFFMQTYVEDPEASLVTAEGLVMMTLVFLNNMLGILQLGIFVRDRLFLFIFGGEDGSMSAVEAAKKWTWEAMIMKYSWDHMPTRFHALAFFLTFSDVDFQRLALDNTEESISLSMAVPQDGNGDYTGSY